MKNCPFCQAELPDEARACSNCGRPFPGAEENHAAAQEEQEETNTIQQQSVAVEVQPTTITPEMQQTQQPQMIPPAGYPPMTGQQNGWNMPAQAGTEQTRHHIFALVSFFAGVVSSFLNGLFFLPSILAIVFGIIALLQIRKQPQIFRGKWFAIIGIILGAVFLVIYGYAFGVIYRAILNDPSTIQQLQEYLNVTTNIL